MAYTTNRKEDTALADAVGHFMDEHFYSKLGEEWCRVSDIGMQTKGVDVEFGGCRIDEKVKVKDGYLNRLLEYPSFELSFINRRLQRQNGWFLDLYNITDYYAFIAVFTEAADEYSVEYGNIDHLNVMFVNKESVKRHVENLGIDLLGDTRALAGGMLGDSIAHNGTGIHIKMSTKFSECPINMVVARRVLYKLDGTREFDVYKDYIEDTIGE